MNDNRERETKLINTSVQAWSDDEVSVPLW